MEVASGEKRTWWPLALISCKGVDLANRFNLFLNEALKGVQNY